MAYVSSRSYASSSEYTLTAYVHRAVIISLSFSSYIDDVMTANTVNIVISRLHKVSRCEPVALRLTYERLVEDRVIVRTLREPFCFTLCNKCTCKTMDILQAGMLIKSETDDVFCNVTCNGTCAPNDDHNVASVYVQFHGISPFNPSLR